MVKIEKEEKQGKFRNVNGHELVVHIDKTPICLRVSILSSHKSICKKCMVLFLLVTTDSVFLLGNLTHMYMIVGFLLISILLLHSVCWTTIEETLIIMRGLGVQIKTKYVIGSKSVFIPQEQVQTIFINEVIFRNRVIFILTIFITNENAKEILIPLFVETLPQLSLLELVLNYTRIKTLET